MKNNKLLYYLLTFIYVIFHIVTGTVIIAFFGQNYIIWMTMVKEDGIIVVIAVTIITIFIFYISMLLFACLSDRFSCFIDKFK